MTEWLAYDSAVDQDAKDMPADTFDLSRRPPHFDSVTDIKLDFFYERDAGEGPLLVSLDKLGQTFTAEIIPGKVTLRKNSGEAAELIGEADLPRSNRPMRVEFSNVDYRVSLRIDGRELLSTTPEQYSPDIGMLLEAFKSNRRLPLPEVRIAASNQVMTLTHISLWRDIYYRNADDKSNMRWGTPENFPDRLIPLGRDEYFVLGDNSMISGDSRYWHDPIHLPHEDLFVRPGVVPGRFLLGKAFFVYWPAGHRILRGGPAIIPNFGDMRFIH